MQVKELATKLGEVELPVRPRPPQFETWKLLPEDAEALARVVLEYVEERGHRPVDSVSVTCKCGHTWTVKYDKVYTITCGDCGQGLKIVSEVKEPK